MYLYSLDREGLWIFLRIHIGQSQQPKGIRILLNSLRTAHNISTTLGYFSKSYPKWNFFDSCARRTRWDVEQKPQLCSKHFLLYFPEEYKWIWYGKHFLTYNYLITIYVKIQSYPHTSFRRGKFEKHYCVGHTYFTPSLAIR